MSSYQPQIEKAIGNVLKKLTPKTSPEELEQMLKDADPFKGMPDWAFRKTYRRRCKKLVRSRKGLAPQTKKRNEIPGQLNLFGVE